MRRIVKLGTTVICCLAAVAAMSSCSEKPTDGEKPSDEETVTTFETVITELHCKADGIDIYGQMYTPKDKEGKLPVVVLSHSSSLTHTAMAPYAEYLVEKGYAAYCFDFCGACDESKSTGRTTDEMTVFTEVEDLEIVLDKIRTLDYIDLDNVFVLGSSQGGLVTALAAEKHPSDIKGMILFYP
ncbi:MAG: alpha/beta hydrolase family protein, partial [Candidatus Cryptobacteroides sp.]